MTLKTHEAMDKQLSGYDVLLTFLGGASQDNYDRTTGLYLDAVEHGEVKFKTIPAIEFSNASGAMHGGWIAGTLDAVAGAAVKSVLRAGESYATISLNVSYLRPLLPGSHARAEGKIIRIGAKIICAEATIIAESRPIALAVANCLRLDR